MLAYLRYPALLAPTLFALVGAYARPQALLALAPDAAMLAYLRLRLRQTTQRHDIASVLKANGRTGRGDLLIKDVNISAIGNPRVLR